MSSLQSLREFISERLAAAAEEICSHCEGTIVQYEQELCRQRRLLDICWKPQLQLHDIDLPQHYLNRVEETGNQEGSSCVEQEVPKLAQNKQENQEPQQIKRKREPEQIKEEHEELCISQDEEKPDLKKETDTMEIPITYEENEHSEADLNNQQICNDQSGNRGQLQSLDRSHLSESQQDRTSQQTQTKLFLRCKQSGESSRVCMSLSVTQTPCKEEPFSCKECNESFENKLNFIMHLKTHEGKKYSCIECKKSYSYSSSLRAHMRTHTGERPFTCKHCGKIFGNKRLLKIHLRTHTEEKPFSCDLCGKCFHQQSHLSIHTRTHTGEKPFPCTVCNKSFRQSSDLRFHMWTHSDRRPFPCNQCERGHCQKSHLRDHMRTHSVECVQQNMRAADTTS